MRRDIVLLVWSVTLLIGCSNTAGPDPSEQYPANIVSLVNSSPFPAKQDVHAESVPSGGFIWLFTLDFGKPHDCPSGCFYSRAWGLRNGDKVAWFQVNEYDESEFPWLVLYDLGPDDSNLLRPEMYRALEDADWWFYRYSFLHRVAQAEDIGRAPLAHAVYSLYSFGDGHLARLLLANGIVRGDRDLLLALAGLPSPGDQYNEVKEEALHLLGLPPGA